MPTPQAQINYLQGSGSAFASANGNGITANVAGFDAAIQVEVVENNTGTVTLALQGSFDGTNWYAVGYQQVDNVAAPARAVATIAVTQNSKHVYQVLDPYPLYRAVLSSISSATVKVRLYAVA